MKWKQDIDSKVFLPSGARIPVLLLGNKCDLLEDGSAEAAVRSEEVEHFVRENHFYAHFLCSAKTGINVKESCTHLVAKIHSNNQAEAMAQEAEREKENAQAAGAAAAAGMNGNAGGNGTVKLGGNENNNESSGGCC